MPVQVRRETNEPVLHPKKKKKKRKEEEPQGAGMYRVQYWDGLFK